MVKSARLARAIVPVIQQHCEFPPTLMTTWAQINNFKKWSCYLNSTSGYTIGKGMGCYVYVYYSSFVFAVPFIHYALALQNAEAMWVSSLAACAPSNIPMHMVELYSRPTIVVIALFPSMFPVLSVQ